MNFHDIITLEKRIRRERQEREEANKAKTEQEDRELERIARIKLQFKSGLDITRIERASTLIDIYFKPSFVKENGTKAIGKRVSDMLGLISGPETGNCDLIGYDAYFQNYRRTDVRWVRRGSTPCEERYGWIKLKDACRHRAVGNGEITAEDFDPIAYLMLNYEKILENIYAKIDF